MASQASADQGSSAETKSLHARCVYTAAAANRQSQIADWVDAKDTVDGGDETRSGLGTELVYASHSSIAIAPDVEARHPRPVQLLSTGHGLLTVVKIAYNRRGRGAGRIVAASDDGWLHVFVREGKGQAWTRAAVWHVKSSGTGTDPSSSSAQRRKGGNPLAKKGAAEDAVPIRAVGVFRQRGVQEVPTGQDTIWIASATSDGEMQLWKLSDDLNAQATLLQRIELGRTRAETRTEILPLDIAMTALPGSDNAVLLAAAGTDNKISLYLLEEEHDIRKLFAIAGHSDWVRSLDICQAASLSANHLPVLMLASGAQDNHIRLWRIEAAKETLDESTKVNASAEEQDEFDKLASQIEDPAASEAIATKSQTFRCGNLRWGVSLDALLTGHEHWISGVRWCPPSPTGSEPRAAALLSSSADNSVILWTPSSGVAQAVSNPRFASFDLSQEQDSYEQNVWVPVQRFGELGNVGSAANGMYGAVWHPHSGADGKMSQTIVGHGYGGAIHVWTREKAGEGSMRSWQARPGRGGHFAAANALRWDPEGDFVISGGSDKTTRLHGALRDRDGESWHEMARPQTHGYEIMGLGWLTRLAFASAGDEKTIRVFEAPTGFVQSAQSLGICEKRSGRNMLVLNLADTKELCNPTPLAEPIKEATRQSLEQGKLDLCVVSPLFGNVSSSHAPQVSFEQAECFLKWCYAMVWGVAIEAQKLLFDVDVLLGDATVFKKKVERTSYDKVFTVEDGTASMPFTASKHTLKAGQKGDQPFPVDTESRSIEQKEAIAMGGTFDHLHVGHKILLSMACLLATRRIVVGVTDDSMLTKKKQAHLLEPIEKRIERVSSFMARFCDQLQRPLQYDVVKLQDVAGPAGTEADLSALLFTDETVGGAEFIDGVREKNGLQKLQRFSIGVIGASGETDISGSDAGELAAAKVGSTAIREWLSQQPDTLQQGEGGSVALDKIGTLNGEPRPIGASVPPLGLSNRAIYAEASAAESTSMEPKDEPSESGQPVGKASRTISSHLSRPPVEEELHNRSIWTEVTKLYGHSLELLALDVDRSHGLVASSCKANHAELAGVRLHDARRGWKEVQVLMGHTLGVTRMRFSQDGERLITVSRDRSWRLYARRRDTSSSQEGMDPFEEVCHDEQAHNRIIYDVVWLGPLRFATASRDGNVKVWTLGENGRSVESVTTLALRQPICALAAHIERQWLALGTEVGSVYIYQSSADSQSAEGPWQQVLALEQIHADAISELAWRPSSAGQDPSTMLASAAKDGAVRIFTIAS